MKDPADISKEEQGYWETLAENTCVCGHPKNQHNDVGGATDLTVGGCDNCPCSSFKSKFDSQQLPTKAKD